MAAASSRLLQVGAAGLALVLMAPLRAVRAEEAAPGSADPERERLEQVRREIERLQAALESAGKQEGTLLGDLHRLDMELDLQRRRLQLLQDEAVQCRREIAQATLRADGLRVRLERQRRLLAARLRALYVSGPPDFARLALSASDPGEVAEGYRLASRIAESDQETITAFRSDLLELRSALEGLEERKASLISLQAQALSRRRELEGLRSDRARLLAGVQREAAEGREALKERVETEQDLQRLVEALVSGKPVSPEWKVGFERFRGLLPWPVPGKVLVPFGALKSSRFDTKIPHPGIDLSVAVGEPVRAVFDGTVAFSDWFKGFGNLVILEHPGGFMTVYAHASERLVARGERVVEGQIIARGGDTGSLEGPRLYFEIWRDGKPEDPVPWMARR